MKSKLKRCGEKEKPGLSSTKSNQNQEERNPLKNGKEISS